MLPLLVLQNGVEEAEADTCGQEMFDAVQTGDIFDGRKLFSQYMGSQTLGQLRQVLESFLKVVTTGSL